MYPIPNTGHRFFVKKIMIIEQTIATVPTITVCISVPLPYTFLERCVIAT